MSENRHKLRVLFFALCTAQLIIMGLGLSVAYQIQRSYSRNIDYESSVNAEHQAVDELAVLSRVTSAGTVTPTDDTALSQISQVKYASNIFLRKAQILLDESERLPNSPLGRSHSDFQDLISQMQMVAEQTSLAQDALNQNEPLLVRARFTYADRAASRVQSVLGNINKEMSYSKDELLLKENAEARRTSLILKPLSILGIFLVLPALLYARRLSKNIMNYEAQLQRERKFLEDRVSQRTSELRTEIKRRERLEFFNNGRNLLLERVAEGNDLAGILVELTVATEQSIPESQCVILLNENQYGTTTIASSLAPDLARNLHAALLLSCQADFPHEKQVQGALWIRDYDPRMKTAFAEVWVQGYRAILVAPITGQKQPQLGIIALLLRDQREPGPFAREVLLSASRMAAVALGHERMQDELFRRAHYDSLTDLPNRILFEDRLNQAVALAGRRTSSVGVLCIDLDGFKRVNDHYGHEAGDWLLQQVAQRLSTQLRKTDTVARLGGDEFIAIIHDNRDGEGVAKASEAFLQLLAEPYSFKGITLHTTASIGVAVYPADGITGAELQRHADMAMYRAKECGRNVYQLYSTDLGDKLARRKQIEQHIQTSLESDGFELLYQPLFNGTRHIVGLEALIRFRSPTLKSISPTEFIRVAEQTGQILGIGEWLVREACRQAKLWQKDGLALVPIAVNISTVQLVRMDFSSRIAQILKEFDLSPQWLHVEITETAIMSDFEEGGYQLRSLADLGVEISIDDFGTGHSSLSYIHHLPIKALKIDRSFVLQLKESHESKAIVRAIVAMAKSLDLRVVAEGVETQEQLDAISAVGCDVFQGYFFAPPLDLPSVTEVLKRESNHTLIPSLS
ncbi:MAG TPA: EAL domain-containing protein [Candidatus Saccharimonadales bacterium]|jgi:diguanylate cyclase (GGDEF)-like protein|nr:EAL domain-containing protein [Candidatus Saccharimonadales bacterium]